MADRSGTKKKKRSKILVIDINRKHITEIAGPLRKDGFRVVTCMTPRGALGRIRQENPDAVIVEVIMPVMTGFEIAARMQADHRLSHVPIFFTTDIQNSDGGNSDYFARPLDMSSLIHALRKRITATPA